MNALVPVLFNVIHLILDTCLQVYCMNREYIEEVISSTYQQFILFCFFFLFYIAAGTGQGGLDESIIIEAAYVDPVDERCCRQRA